MAGSRNSGVDRLLAQVRPRWSRERHERNFAAILERIRREEGRVAQPPRAAGNGLRLSHAVR